ncbi:MAG TPA: helix-turn-helix domain-containing protein [Solirubrobacterales bacterium]|nr:helix-turn-helix domain-containing protein [Solirubrobacterales bacterium]
MPKKTPKKSRDRKLDPTGRIIYALGHPLRRRILEALMREPASASTLAAQFGMGDKLGVVSYHLCKALHGECKVVEIIATYPRRGALEKVFAVRPDAFAGVIDWARLPRFAAFGLRGVALESFLKAAAAALEAEAASDKAEEPNGHGRYEFRPVGVDAGGRREIEDAAETLAETVRSVAARCSGSEPAELTQLVVGTAVFEPTPLFPGEAG